MNINVLKLWKQMLQLAEIETDKAKLIVESELAEGVEVFVEQEGEFVPAEDGEYATEDKIIVVAEGKVVEIRDKEEQKPEEAEQPEEEVVVEQAEEEVVVEQPEEPARDERDERIAEMEAVIAEKDARIAELEAEVAQKDEQLQMSADKPAKDKVKEINVSGAMKYFK